MLLLILHDHLAQIQERRPFKAEAEQVLTLSNSWSESKVMVATPAFLAKPMWDGILQGLAKMILSGDTPMSSTCLISA